VPKDLLHFTAQACVGLALEGLSTYFEFMALPKETCQDKVPLTTKQQLACLSGQSF